jgi:hypothetical protein
MLGATSPAAAILLGIIVTGPIGLVSDLAFTAANWRLFAPASL